MTNERTSNIAAETPGMDLPLAAIRLVSSAEFGEPAIQDRSLRSLLILIGHEQEQNGPVPC
jgi:hypothetical protein